MFITFKPVSTKMSKPSTKMNKVGKVSKTKRGGNLDDHPIPYTMVSGISLNNSVSLGQTGPYDTTITHDTQPPTNGAGHPKTINDKQQIEKLVTKIFEQPSECSFDKSQNAVCSPKTIVNKMAEFLVNKGEKVQTNDPKKIVSNMKEMMNCNSESCVIKHPDFIKFAKMSNVDGILDEFFKPSGPAMNFGLLSNYNIDEVLDQLQSKFPHFLHIPFQMRDFEKIGSELATIDLAAEYKKGTKTFGVVLNTDWHSGRGIHWYCLFGEMQSDKIIIEYFNSSGREPLPETQAWLQKQKHYLTKKLGIPVHIKYSTGIQFQNDEHSCGVYCLMYIWLRLEGIPNVWFKADTFNDKFMHDARRVIFRHEI